MVNTASECGFTPQFEGLEALYKEKDEDDFVILGFPADDIANQEPRDDAEIAEFCEANFGVTFPMFSKSNVVEDPVNPLFAALRGGPRRADLQLQQVPAGPQGPPGRALRHLGRAERPRAARRDRRPALADRVELPAPGHALEVVLAVL